jgi:hypothetical protein
MPASGLLAIALSDFTEKVVFALIGGGITLLVQRIQTALNEKRSRFQVHRLAFRGLAPFHQQLFWNGLTDDIWQKHVPTHLRDTAVTYVFFVKAVGRAVAKDVRVTVHARNGAGIAAHMFLVDRTAICERLTTSTEEDRKLVGKWGYINPGDAIELHLLGVGVTTPDDIEIGIDGEGIEVTNCFLRQETITALACTGRKPVA